LILLCGSSKFASSDGEQLQFAEDFEELANLEKFLDYQDQLHLEEVARELLRMVGLFDFPELFLFFCSFLCLVGVKRHFLPTFVLASFNISQ
jgi:hypothetical protein